MTVSHLAVTVLVLALAGCAAAGEPPALAPDAADPSQQGDPYFLKRGFMGGFENRVYYEPRSAARTAAKPDL